MEFLKNIILKFFTKEKLLAYAVGAVIAAGAAGASVNQKDVKDLVCQDYVKKSE